MHPAAPPAGSFRCNRRLLHGSYRCLTRAGEDRRWFCLTSNDFDLLDVG